MEKLQLFDGLLPEPVVMVSPPIEGRNCEPGKHCAAHGSGPFWCCLCGASFMPALASAPTPLQIEIIGSADWGCDHTDADAEAYADAVVAAVQTAYPGAEVSYTEEQVARTYARVWGVSLAEEATIKETAVRICQDVWDDGDFWP